MRTISFLSKFFCLAVCLTAILVCARPLFAEEKKSDSTQKSADSETPKKDADKKDTGKKDTDKKDTDKKDADKKDTDKKDDDKKDAEKSEKAAPAHQVTACYFHRTNRCNTCKKISGYIEESIADGFKEEMKGGSVSVVMIDFQDPKNKKYVDAYKITGPTLVIMDLREGKVKNWKAAPKVWSLVTKKDEFFKYVQKEMRDYLESK
jgi:hypothetical protein